MGFAGDININCICLLLTSGTLNKVQKKKEKKNRMFQELNIEETAYKIKYFNHLSDSSSYFFGKS